MTSVNGVIIGLASLMLLALIPSSVLAQSGDEKDLGSAPQSPLSVAQFVEFQTTLRSLAVENHVAFVVEGIPFRAQITDAKLNKIVAGPDRDAAISAVAKAYDYRWEQRGNVFLLSKLYSDRRECPDVSQAECLHSVQEICRIAGPFNPRLVDSYRIHLKGETYRNPVVGELADSLSKNQITALEHGGLKASALTPAQNLWVHRAALYFYVELFMDSAERCLAQLQTPSREVVLRYGNLGRLSHVLGIERPDGPQRKHYFFPLEGKEPSASGDPGLQGPTPRSSDLVQNGIDSATLLPNIPTIADLASHLEARDAALRLDIDPGLKNKKVLVIGEESAAPPDTILGAVAALFDLTVLKDVSSPKAALRMTYTSIKVPENEVALRGSLYSALPKQMRDQMRIDEARELQEEMQDLTADSGSLDAGSVDGGAEPREETVEELREAMRKLHKREAFRPTMEADARRRLELERSKTDLRAAAVARLLDSARPKLQPSSGESISLLDLPETAKDAYAMLSMTGFLPQLTQLLTSPVPAIVTDPETIVLTGGVHSDASGKRFIALFLSTPSLTGKGLDPGPGMAMVPYSK